MSTAVNIHEAEVKDASAWTPAERPTPEQIDDLVREYLANKKLREQFAEDLAKEEAHLVQLVQTWGAVPAGAEKSRRLSGRLAEITVTRSDTITIDADRVGTLRDSLYVNGHGAFFSKLFTQQPPKWELVKGADAALKEEQLPKRLAEKVLNLFGRCFTPKPQKPRLSVTMADPAKPAKKSRAKKGGE